MGPDDSDAFYRRLRQSLESLAPQRRTITYRELAVLAAVPEPHRIHKLTLALEELAREDHTAGRPLLAALAVSRSASGLPGRGFFELLAELGRYDGPPQGPEAATWHAAELERAWGHWASRRPPGP